jgi:DNA-binding MarR family transcriptional regulator
MSSELRKKVVMSLAEKPKTPKQISIDTGMYLSHVSKIVKDLSKNNILECLTPKLKKGRLYTLTGEGKEILEQLVKTV